MAARSQSIFPRWPEAIMTQAFHIHSPCIPQFRNNTAALSHVSDVGISLVQWHGVNSSGSQPISESQAEIIIFDFLSIITDWWMSKMPALYHTGQNEMLMLVDLGYCLTDIPHTTFKSSRFKWFKYVYYNPNHLGTQSWNRDTAHHNQRGSMTWWITK